MLSAGNDIVSLVEINVSRTHLKQFYSKILSAEEISLYENSLTSVIPFEKYVWLLWSIKEAAYKFLKRMDATLVFTPVKFRVDQLDVPKDYRLADFDAEITAAGFRDVSAVKSTLKAGIQNIYACSVLYHDFISSVANNEEDFEAVYWGIKRIGVSDHVMQSEEVRKFLFKRTAILTGQNKLTLNKDNHGIPILHDGTRELPIPVSFAHHGEYVGYSFRLR